MDLALGAVAEAVFGLLPPCIFFGALAMLFSAALVGMYWASFAGVSGAAVVLAVPVFRRRNIYT